MEEKSREYDLAADEDENSEIQPPKRKRQQKSLNSRKSTVFFHNLLFWQILCNLFEYFAAIFYGL